MVLEMEMALGAETATEEVKGPPEAARNVKERISRGRIFLL